MPRGKKGTGPGKPVPAPRTMAVRMLYGERAGQIVQVTAKEAVELCRGWTPRAEPVAVKPSDTAERR